MSRVRILDAYKPGYNRTPLGDVRKVAPPGGAGTVGSQVMNQAQAEMRGAKSIARAGLTFTSVPVLAQQWFFTVAANGPHGETDWNEFEFWSGPNGTGTKYTVSQIQANPSPQNGANAPVSALINGNNTISASGGMYSGWWSPSEGNTYWFNLGSFRSVGSIVIYGPAYYRAGAVHIDAYVGSTWLRVINNFPCPDQDRISLDMGTWA